MRVTVVTDPLDSPTDPGWEAVPREAVPLAPVPLDAQPNAYIRAAWEDRPYGLVSRADVAVARNNRRLFVRIEWSGSTGPATNGSLPEFTDAAGVFFPAPGGSGGNAGPPANIGTRESPVTLWLWRDLLPVQRSLPAARALLGCGPGVFRPLSETDGAKSPSDNSSISATSQREGLRWAVVISGEAPPADALRMGLAVWDGANEERAGIGAVTHQWIELEAGT